ncbi:cyclic peptide export ABC transporter [Halalkalibacterium halodurans]|uniref:cyclic peptide export ABC transporter n=1 Tax=Halalkalibacterium halodurans TaxID=86665 RepID=UPI00106860CB|nr:cyclic peptide export ABC transporter [Halalkalibacterium halodurans]TES55749.1 cyclic peptide export ABC transporter [Halalkalibacterium halodurans]
MSIYKYLFSISKKNVLYALIAGLISGASSTGVIAVINHTINNQQSTGYHIVLAFIALCLTMLLSSLVSGYLLIKLAQGSIINLRINLSKRILSTPLRKVEQNGSHRLLASLTDDVMAIANAITVSPMLIINLFIVLGCLIYMGWLSISVLFIGLTFMTIAFFSYQMLMKIANKYLASAREEHDSLFRHFKSLTSGTKELKMSKQRRIDFFDKQLTPTIRGVYKDTVKGMTIYTAAGNWGQMLFLFFIALVIFFIPQLNLVSTEILTGYTLSILYMITPLVTILNVFPNFGRANVALRKIEKLELATEDEELMSNREQLPSSFNEIRLIDLTHTYYREEEDHNFTLGPINLTFKENELIFLVGGNGSGKTTLAKLITGLYEPEGGRIEVNGQPITDKHIDHYRQLFSTVFSDFYLFEQFIGISEDKVKEEAEEYLRLLQLNHKVKVEEDRLSTTDLSGGQRKRLALLVSYLEDRPFYVFDEWAADQDPLFKDFFYTKLLPALKGKGKTVLVISHDDKYFNVADRIIKIDYGQVIKDEPIEALSQQAAE